MHTLKTARSRLLTIAAIGLLLLAVPWAGIPEARAKGPADLGVDAIRLGNTSEHDQSMLTIQVKVKNHGGSDVDGFDVAITGPGVNESRHVGGLKAGKSTDIDIKVPYPQTAGSIRVTIDPKNAVAESNEGNNTASALIPALTVATPQKSSVSKQTLFGNTGATISTPETTSLPDLTLTKADVRPDNKQQGLMRVYYTVANIGTATVYGGVKLYIWEGDLRDRDPIWLTFPDLKPGEDWSTYFVIYQKPNDIAGKLVVDGPNEITESNEDNNSIDFSVPGLPLFPPNAPKPGQKLNPRDLLIDPVLKITPDPNATPSPLQRRLDPWLYILGTPTFTPSPLH
jgi:hypothetical protein